jgi:hypothetical protein
LARQAFFRAGPSGGLDAIQPVEQKSPESHLGPDATAAPAVKKLQSSKDRLGIRLIPKLSARADVIGLVFKIPRSRHMYDQLSFAVGQSQNDHKPVGVANPYLLVLGLEIKVRFLNNLRVQ